MTAERRTGVLSGPLSTLPPVHGYVDDAYIATDGIHAYFDTGTTWQEFMSHAPSFPPPIDPGGDTGDYVPPTPAYIIDTDYEDVTMSFFNAGGSTGSISTANPHHGVKHFRDVIVGGVHSTPTKNIAGGVRQVVFREWFSVTATPNGLTYLVAFIGPIAFSVRINSSRQVSAYIGSAGVSVGAPVAANAYHALDGVIDVTADPATFTLRVDGGTDVTTSAANPVPSNFSRLQYDQSVPGDLTIDHDQLRVHNTASFYPLTDA